MSSIIYLDFYIFFFFCKFFSQTPLYISERVIKFVHVQLFLFKALYYHNEMNDLAQLAVCRLGYQFQPSSLPETYYRRRRNGQRSIRHEAIGYGVALQRHGA